MVVITNWREFHPIEIVGLLVLFSLVVALIAFGILKSTAISMDEKTQLNGAIAGFMVTLGTTGSIYTWIMHDVKKEMEKSRDFQEKLVKESLGASITDFILPFPRDSEFKRDKHGTYEIKIRNQPITGKKEVVLVFKPPNDKESWPGGWTWQCPSPIIPGAILSMELVEDNGKKWYVREIPMEIKTRASLNVQEG